MTTTSTNDVVANALAEVAKARGWRERNEAQRRQTFSGMAVRQSVFVLARKKPEEKEPCKQ
ncbi:MAG: hypothetical protein O9256_03560 [Rhizobiaceae bacterium]|nr:hypothetical protein [Rhizobiaceae bacterium]